MSERGYFFVCVCVWVYTSARKQENNVIHASYCLICLKATMSLSVLSLRSMMAPFRYLLFKKHIYNSYFVICLFEYMLPVFKTASDCKYLCLSSKCVHSTRCLAMHKLQSTKYCTVMWG